MYRRQAYAYISSKCYSWLLPKVVYFKPIRVYFGMFLSDMIAILSHQQWKGWPNFGVSYEKLSLWASIYLDNKIAAWSIKAVLLPFLFPDIARSLYAIRDGIT
jgi:hypothetical protein